MVPLVVKNPPTNAGDARDMGSIPGLGRFLGGGHSNPLQYSGLGRFLGGGHSNPLQYSCLGNHMNRGGWRATFMGSQRVGRD